MSAETPTPAAISDEALERAHAQVVQPLFLAAVLAGDQVVYAARSLVSLLVLVQVAVFRWDELVALEPAPLLVSTCLVAAMVAPPAIRVFTRKHWDVENRAMLSVLADAATVFLALAPLVLWPPAGYQGLLREVEPGFFAVAVAAAGLRLLRRAVLLGAVLNVAGASALLWADRLLHPELISYQTSDVALFAILLASTGLLAWLLANRTRRLVYESANATMLAERARQRLGVYISEELASQALSGAKLELGGARRDVAVLFSDLRGFTSYSEHLPPERLVTELNAYLDAMVREIRAEGGIVDKYIGDAIMAVFGLTATGPDTGAEAAARALRAATRMNAALDTHNVARAGQGLPVLKHGIGLHAGPVIAGNIGTAERMQYTVIGDVVNTASRLESATKEHAVRVLASVDLRDAAVRAGTDPALLSPHGTLQIRGREKALEVFSVAGDAGAVTEKAE